MLVHSNPLYLLLALVLLIIYIPILVKRWQIILKIMGYKIQYKECFHLILGALPLTSVTPSKSGDVIKAYYLKGKVPISKTVGSVLTERILDVSSLVLFSLIGMLFYQRFELAGIALIILIGIIVIFFVSQIDLHFPIRKSWNDKLRNVILSTKMLMKDKKAFSATMLCSLSIWFLSIVQTMIFFYAVGIKIPLLFTMANIPIAIFIGMMPVTVGGMGTRDAAIIFLFSEYAGPSELLGVGILFSLFRYWLPSLVGIPFMRSKMLM
ncbi:hypothetical protein ES704_01782 [subsurface metagenome]